MMPLRGRFGRIRGRHAEDGGPQIGPGPQRLAQFHPRGGVAPADHVVYRGRRVVGMIEVAVLHGGRDLEAAVEDKRERPLDRRRVEAGMQGIDHEVDADRQDRRRHGENH